MTVGSELDYPPFALVRQDGTADGFTVDLWRAVAREVHLDASIQTGPFHDILERFKDGRIDVLINLAQSEERRRYADFSVPHVKMGGALFVRRGEGHIESEQDLADKSLIVIEADLWHDHALARGWTRLTLVDTVASGLKLLADFRHHDAMLVGRLVGLNTLRELKLGGIEPLDVKLDLRQDFAFAVRKGNAELLAEINDGLANVRASGAYDEIYKRWFGDLEPHPVTLRTVLTYLAPALALLFLLLFAYLRERGLRLRSKQAVSALDATLESTAAGVLVLDLEGRVTHCNQKFLDLWHIPAAWVATRDGDTILRFVLGQLAEPKPILARLGNLATKPLSETFDLLRFKEGRYHECSSKPQIIAGEAVGRVWSFHDVSERIRSGEALYCSNRLLATLSRVQASFISGADSAALFAEMLEILKEVTSSEYGFIGEVLRAAGGEPYLKTRAITNIAWDRETRERYREPASPGLVFTNLRTLCGAVMTSGAPVIANDPAGDPRSAGTVRGQPPLRAFLGLPFHRGEELIGIVGVANRPGGYEPELMKFLEPFLHTCAALMIGLRLDEERSRAETALAKLNATLEQQVAERTEALRDSEER